MKTNPAFLVRARALTALAAASAFKNPLYSETSQQSDPRLASATKTAR